MNESKHLDEALDGSNVFLEFRNFANNLKFRLLNDMPNFPGMTLPLT